MANFRLSIFDLAAYITPGIVVLLSLAIGLNEKIISSGDLITIVKEINLTTSFILLGFAYVIGFATYQIGSYFYRLINKWIWKDTFYKSPNENSDENVLEAYKWSKIREYSPANFIVINRWAALKGMASNLTIVLFFLAISCTFKFKNKEFFIEWMSIFIACLMMSFLLLIRARVFKKYLEYDKIGILKMINEKLNKEIKTP